MNVVKRSGEAEPVSFDKVAQRLVALCEAGEHGAALPGVDVTQVAQKVIAQLHDGVQTSKLDQHAAELCASLSSRHPDYGVLSTRLAVSDCHKATPRTFAAAMRRLWESSDRAGAPNPLVTAELLRAAELPEVEAAIDYALDYRLDYFGFCTLRRGYLLRDGAGELVERPQHMWMRVALGVHGEADLPAALETYRMMSGLLFTHASPTLYNAGTPRPQLSSCFLLVVKEDSIEGIYDTLRDCARISKWAGGIGVSMHDVRASGSLIRGTNGESTGLVPIARVYNATARNVNQGGRRLGSFAIYLEPWHADVFQWIELRRAQGAEEDRARDLFYALWVPDLFMRRVEAGGDWSLMCPNECPGLAACHGAAFDELYERYEREGRARRTVKADALWRAMVASQIETGNPYVLFKDAVNRKSNQAHLGTVRSSNLCAEIVQFSSPEEAAVCNLGSLCLPAFVRPAEGAGGAPSYDHAGLHAAAARLVRNLDRVIDRTFYPVEEARRSNLLHRPMGVGAQGLADVFALMGLPFESEGARALNRAIYETVYRAAVLTSCDLARERTEAVEAWRAATARGDAPEVAKLLALLAPTDLDDPTAAPAGGPPPGAHPSFAGSPASRGLLQHDLWAAERGEPVPLAYDDWPEIREAVRRHGLRNSLLTAAMPTASTASIMGNNESFEPFGNMLMTRKVLAGTFVLVNKHLVRRLRADGLWSEALKDRIVAADGSVQGVQGVPADVQEAFKTVWEVKQRAVIEMAADRGPFIDQSSSMNLYFTEPSYERITNALFFAWKKGLKTGVYYTRVLPRAAAQKFSLVQKVCSLADRGACESCSA